VVDSAISRFGDAIEIEPLDLPLVNVQQGLVHWSGKEFHPDLSRSVRILPGDGMDGFYLCKLIKRVSTWRQKTAQLTRKRHRAGRRRTSSKWSGERPK
jgi:hypothetical protein